MEERLQKVIASSGLTSRRKAEELIAEGRVSVNGKTVRNQGVKVDPSTDTVKVDGKALPSHRETTYLLYKPKGYVSSRKKQFNERIVTELVPASPPVYPVGRLDAESEGLILLTNRGDLAQQLTHPSFGHEKEYVVTCSWKEERRRLAPDQLHKLLTSGVKLGDGLAKALRVDVEAAGDATPLILRIVVQEGRHHLIRRMCAAAGLKVVRLVRTRIGKMGIGTLKPGAYRLLTSAEIASLV